MKALDCIATGRITTAVFVIDELGQKDMKDYHEYEDGRPEERRKAADGRAMSMQREYMMLVRRRDHHFLHVNC